MANGQIEQEDFSPRRKDDMEPILEITNNAILADYLQREGLKNYREFVKVDVFNIEMKDGTFVKYKRRPISDDEFEELEDIRAQFEGGKDLQGKTLERYEVRNLQKLYWNKACESYLINAKTNKPMSAVEKRQIRYADVIRGIIGGCMLRTTSDAVEGKK